jgi:uracil-DNA glycosylase
MGNEDLLKRIATTVTKCQKCRLAKTRIKAVPGEGNSKARVIFIGEGPGFNEDQQGRPFVGAAGHLLDELLKQIKMQRSDVWIGNVVKCRPPENRDPMVDEVRACTPYLDDQIKAIKPKVIIPLGKHALEHFLKDGKISRDHGVAKVYGSYVIYPVYHPAAALRSTGVKRVLETDFKNIPDILQKDLKEFKIVGTARLKDGSQMNLI